MVEVAFDAKAHHLRSGTARLNPSGRGVLPTAPSEEFDTKGLRVRFELHVI